MFFFNDECDLADDDQYDLFTLATEVARRSGPLYSPGPDKNRKCFPVAELLARIPQSPSNKIN